ncbi:hypothetical protein [Aquimarina rhabdastrellae]
MALKIFKSILKLIIFLMLTVITQIGGIIYAFVELLPLRRFARYRFLKIVIFTVLYAVSTFYAVPKVAALYGRVPIHDTPNLKAHSVITKLCNRNYVDPSLNTVLKQAAIALHRKHQGIYLVYLDASFPFFNQFPLLPHLSHNDGKKIDISFIYKDQNGNLVNQKPSISGYGVFEAPTGKEHNQIITCKQQGSYWYDFTQYATLGTIYTDLAFAKKATKDLLLELLKRKDVQKIFIEPHLKDRLQLKSSKIRFQGCSAVRHDDHIHLEIQ